MNKNENIKGLVSVGLPTYNRPESLKRALEFITKQTYKQLEIIVSDNASSDNRVKKIVDDFLSVDARIVYFKQKQNTGVLANAEFVLKKSSGEYFMWFSDDDWRAPEFIENLVDQLESNKHVNMAFCDYHEVYEDGSRALGYPDSHLEVYKPFLSSHRLIRTITYYMQNAKRGKSNIFYSLFRKRILDTLDITRISGEFTHLNMDCLIVFSMLQLGPVAMVPEAMCTLTCGNQKYYNADANSVAESKSAFLPKIAHYLSVQRKDRDLYIRNTERFIEKVAIYCSFPIKLITTICSYAVGKYWRADKGMGGTVRMSEHDANVNKKQDGNKLKLPNVTLVAMATRNVEETLQALIYSCKEIEFGAVKLLSHFTPYGMDGKVDFVRIQKIKDIDEWSYKIVYELHKYIDTDYALLVHADGFVVNPSAWRDDFLDYDYIGAPWPLPKDDFSYRDIHGEIVRVGNSVSLRSKRLLELPKNLQIPWEPDHGYLNEDGFLCVKNRHIFEENGIVFSPLEVAKYFSHETMIPEVRNIMPFAFHKWAGSNQIYPKF